MKQQVMTTGEFKSARLASMSESAFQKHVIALAKHHAWRVAHFRPARTSKGWRTAVSADGAGFPDLILTRGTRLIAAELKRKGGKLTDLQDQWLNAFTDAGAEAYLWTPDDIEDIENVLTRRHK